MTRNYVKDALFGVAVGDALGVPVEFKSREYLTEKPVDSMLSYGTYGQPAGTWSDDSSLTFCLAESLCSEFSLQKISESFIGWKYKANWTPYNEVFDIGITTSENIELLRSIIRKKEYEKLETLHLYGDERSNGNGSLMRILPLLFYFKDTPLNDRFSIILKVSSLTHPHIRAAIACHIYLTFAHYIIEGDTKVNSYKKTQEYIKHFFEKENIEAEEREIFSEIIENDISTLDISEIKSSGYVIDSLEASFWCVLNNQSYRETVIQAVNLGHDTDTTAAIAGGLAGLLYGFDNIPKNWVNISAKSEEISKLAENLNNYVNGTMI